jgi:hypothetical protein
VTHRYTFNELFDMDLDELRLVALMVGVVFTSATAKDDLIVEVMRAQSGFRPDPGE